MPDIGTIICSPADNFSFPRSYLRQLAFTTNNWPYFWDGQLFYVSVGDPLTFTDYVLFRENIIPWSSNCYTLDFVVQEAYYTVPGNPTHNPATDILSWQYLGDPPVATLLIDFVAVTAPFTFVPLPPAPAGWWSG